MGQQANEDRDYDEYKVKVKRYDKDGNDISGDKLGGGQTIAHTRQISPKSTTFKQ